MIVLSLGAGVQSSVVLMMSARGELPKIDHAVFADTGWEPPAVYAQLKWLTKEVDIPISVVSKGDLRKTVIDRQVRLDKTRGRGGTWGMGQGL